MKQSVKYIFPILFIFVGIDFLWNLQEFYNQPLQGDIVPLVLPDKVNAPVLKDPFGINALITENYHPNINRFFSTITLYSLFHSVPFALQQVVHPVESLYLTAAIFKGMVYLGFLLMITRLVVGPKAGWKDWILSLFLLTPLMQVGGYFGNIELVGSSIVYQCFYSFPLLLLLVWCLPFFDALKPNLYFKFEWWKLLLLLGLTIFCSFSSALMPGIVLIGGSLYYYFFYLKNRNLLFEGGKPVSLFSLLNYQHLLLLLFMFLSAYSFFLGGYNPESVTEFSIIERYQKMCSGMVKHYLEVPSLPIIFVSILINYFILKRNKALIWNRSFGSLAKPILLFIFFYVLLLPLGGYRSYREVILRSDVLLPTTILIFFLFVISSFTVIKFLKGTLLKRYSIFIGLLTFIFTFYDIGSIPSGKNCEAKVLYQISNTEDEILNLSTSCKVMDWEAVENPMYYKNHAKFWQKWNLANQKVLIAMPKN